MKTILIISLVVGFMSFVSPAHAVNPDDYIDSSWMPVDSFHSHDQPEGQKNWIDPVTGMEFVWVPKGCFLMGNAKGRDNEKPVHEVCVDGFWIGRYEVTQRQWKKILKPTHWNYLGENLPAVNVSWLDVSEFIRQLNSKGREKFRLPTEAEWEYAARSGGRKELFSGGKNVDELAWYHDNSRLRFHPVGQKKANGLGIYDMSGNVMEWCADSYDKNAYSKLPKHNPANKDSGGKSYRVMRGGHCQYPPAYVDVFSRMPRRKDYRDQMFGFRLVRIPD